MVCPNATRRERHRHRICFLSSSRDINSTPKKQEDPRLSGKKRRYLGPSHQYRFRLRFIRLWWIYLSVTCYRKHPSRALVVWQISFHQLLPPAGFFQNVYTAPILILIFAQAGIITSPAIKHLFTISGQK
jgi:hypothetical protein